MSVVYFISDGEYIKIGMSYNVEKRLAALQTSNPRALKLLRTILVPNEDWARYLEQELHKHFGEKRVAGEWFLLDWELSEPEIERLYQNIGHKRNLFLQMRFNQLVEEDIAKNYAPLQHYDKTNIQVRVTPGKTA